MKLSETDLENLRKIYDYMKINDDLPEKVDVIIVAGMVLRTDGAERAFELYEKGVSKKIVFSGWTNPETGVNEGEFLANHTMKLGLPEDKILVEKYARNTAENLLLSLKILNENEIVPKSIILVHKPYMTRRLKATAKAQWPQPQPKFYVTSVDESFDEYLDRNRKLGMGDHDIWMMLGDYKRMTPYAEKGWQTSQPKDDDAERAFHELEKAGFEMR